MASALKEISCPNCGSSVSQYNATSQTLVCQVCNSHINAGDGQMIGKGQKLAPPPKPIKLGQTGIFNGVSCVVLGRVYYEGWATNDSSDRWVWTEWLLGAKDGRMFWLSYDDEAGFVISHKRRIKAPFQPLTDSLISLDSKGSAIRVKERYPARIVGAEGEITWQAKAGDRQTMIEGHGFGREYSIQFTAEELEMYEGIALDEEAVAKAFGDETWQKRSARNANNQQLLFFAGIAALVFGCVALILAAVFYGSAGSRVMTETLSVNREAPVATFAFDVSSVDRPMMIKLSSSSLPLNSWAELEVSVTDPSERETFIGGNEFWHETGVDDGGRWEESDYSGSVKFIPVTTGKHFLKVEMEDAATTVSGASLEVEIFRDHVVYTWLLIYGIVVVIGGFILMAMANPRQTGNLISSMFEDD